jgi:transcriptional regulator with GAF, ATPase, and Fis domain
MVVQSESMRKLVNDIIRIAPYRVPILIQGDSGTGKELVADALHRLGPAPLGPFVTFNCSNLVASLVEAQLFGHVAGAFTDTREDSRGYFRSANGGTLFLDEVGELPLALQPKLLRVLESHEVQPVGSTNSFKTNVRIVAATNRDLIAMIKAGQFRDDLYYRLRGASIYIPPLRSRREAVGALTAHFVECYNRLFDKQVHLISCRGLDLLESFAWPGNVRELANAIRDAVMLTARDRLCVTDFPGLILDGGQPTHALGCASIHDSAEPQFSCGDRAVRLDPSGNPELLDPHPP